MSKRAFDGSANYWESRYRSGGDSGKGSYGELAEFKANILNRFIAQHGVGKVIEFGCGDGNQLSLAKYERYIGYDVSAHAIETCRRQFQHDSSKRFLLMDEYANETADLTMSLDVLFHLVEEEVFDLYMRRLFQASDRYVAIYSSNRDRPVEGKSPHVRHRAFSTWIERNAPEFQLLETAENRFRHGRKSREGFGSPSDFYFYEKGRG